MERTYGPPVGMNDALGILQETTENRVFISGFNLYKFIMVLSVGNWCFVNPSGKTGKRKKISFFFF